jgi:U6 snRNA-associated Sm-like protein LSm8
MYIFKYGKSEQVAKIQTQLQLVQYSRLGSTMSLNLQSMVDKLVTIITTDGRLLVGYLRGYDQTTNLILSASQERTISPDEPCTTEDLGLYILRGDNVALVGETDEEKDQSINWYVHVIDSSSLWSNADMEL